MPALGGIAPSSGSGSRSLVPADDRQQSQYAGARMKESLDVISEHLATLTLKQDQLLQEFRPAGASHRVAIKKCADGDFSLLELWASARSSNRKLGNPKSDSPNVQLKALPLTFDGQIPRKFPSDMCSLLELSANDINILLRQYGQETATYEYKRVSLRNARNAFAKFIGIPSLSPYLWMSASADAEISGRC